jgi:hypothetical protein
MGINLERSVADEAPSARTLTGYDEEHLVIYLRLLDAAADGAPWTEVAREVLNIDPEREPKRAWGVWGSHLARAGWLNANGYRHLIRCGARH